MQLRTDQTFAVDPSRVVHETIDGEAILIDLESGIYYSLTGCGPDVWARLLAGWSRDEIAAAAPRIAAAEIDEMIIALHGAGLLRRCDDIPRSGVDEPWASDEPPVLTEYKDMEYFLLLDPVHDVEPAGWPHAGRQP